MRVDPFYVSNLVGALDGSQAQTQQLSAEMSSGVRVTSISSDPLAAGQNVSLLNQMRQDDTFTQSSSIVSGQLQVGDSALGQVVAQLTEAITVATAANNGTMNSADVSSSANQLAGIRAEIVALANSSYQGQYIFAGGQSGAAPFSAAGNGSAVSYSGDQGINYLETPSGQKIQLNLPGDQVFDGSGTNSVFKALDSLIADYTGGTASTAQAVQDTQSLSRALNYVSQQRVTLDNSLVQVNAATSAVSSEKTQLSAAQTNLMQADVAQIATQISLTETQQTALEAIIARFGSDSLFSKL